MMRFSLYFLCFLFILCAVPHSSFAQDKYLDIQEVKTQSGLTAWLVEDHSIPTFSLQFAFKEAGAKYDPADKQGLSRLASNTMDEGAAELTGAEFQKLLQGNRISLSFSASRDHYSGTLEALSAKKDLAFDLLYKAINKPRFDDEAIERMRAANIARIKSSLSNPKWIAARLQNDVVYQGHPYALNSGGTLTSLQSITKEDLKNFHKTLGKDLVIAASGDITAQELRTALDKVFGSLTENKKPPLAELDLQNAGETYIYEMDIPQTIIEITQPGIRRNDPNFYSAYVMNFILGQSGFGSRLMEEIREKRGLTYGVYSYFREYEHSTTMHVSSSTANETAAELIALTAQEWDKMKAEPVSAQELSEAKSYLIGSLPLSLTSNSKISSMLLSLQLDDLPIDYLDKRAGYINAVSAEDVQKIAQKLLEKEKFTTILVGKPTQIESATFIDHIPNVQ